MKTTDYDPTQPAPTARTFKERLPVMLSLVMLGGAVWQLPHLTDAWHWPWCDAEVAVHVYAETGSYGEALSGALAEVLPAELEAALGEAYPTTCTSDTRTETYSPEELVQFRIHGVTPGFIAGLAEVGYTCLEGASLLAMKIHGVTPTFAREMTAATGAVDAETLLAMKIHGVTPAFAREMEAALAN